MINSIIQGHSEVRVEDKNLLQKVDCFLWCGWVLEVQVHSSVVWERLQVLQGFLICDEALVVFGGGPDEVEDDG